MSVFAPSRSIEDILGYWWLIALLTVWGGAVAGYYHNLRPPIYEAQAVIFISIDFSQTGELTQFEQDQAAWGAAGVFVSDPVVTQVVADARAQGIPADIAPLRTHSHFERRQARWILRVRDPDPQTAAALTNLWARHGFAALTEAHRHALQAQVLRRRLQELEACRTTAQAGAGQGLCQHGSLEELEEAIRATISQLEAELAASQGVLPVMVISQPESATVPQKPAQFGRNTLILAGGLIGFLLGAVVVHTRLPEGLVRRVRRG